MKLKYEKCMTTRAFKEPLQDINEQYVRLDMIIKNMQNNIINKVKDSRNKAINLIEKLDTLSPLKTLARGYSITKKEDQIIKKAKDLKAGDKITIRFSDGEKNAEII